MYYIIELLATIIAVSLVLSVHEFAHAFIALKCGDNTAKLEGRLSLNPFVHLDLLGFLSLVLFHFGWAKPVPVNYDNFDNRRKGILWVSIAGILANVIFAFVSYPLFILSYKFLPDILLFDDLIINVFYSVYILNLTFAIFNFLPIFPLDGFNFIFELFNIKGEVYDFLKNKGIFILLTLIILSGIAARLSYYNPFFSYLDILGYVLNFVKSIIAWPIEKFWGIIF